MTKPTIQTAFFVVEATHLEMAFLHEINDRKPLVKWDSVSIGQRVQVGEMLVDGTTHPVTLLVWFAKLNGHLVAFYFPCSLMVNHLMIEKGLEAECNAYANGRRCNSVNFRQCLTAVGAA